MSQLLIDARFILKADTHTITDLKTNTETRLEPRLVKLLLILAGNAGQVVTRDEIIREVWNDYGGAEDGLNQAISFLRKMLDDEKKEKISTIPKKGYLLNVAVSTGKIPQSADVVKASPLRFRKAGFLTAIIVLIIVLLLIFGRRAFRDVDEPQGAPADEVRDTTYQYQEMKKDSAQGK